VSAAAPPKMETRRLSVAFGETRVLSDVTLEIPTGRVTCLIGPSGCGKSTFLRALNRMNELTEGAQTTGRVLLDGEDIYAPGLDAVAVRRRVGMVFQRSNPFPKSIAANVAFGLKMAGLRDRRALAERVEESLRAAALWDEVKDRLDASAMTLSGGQQQRLCIARAIATRPEVLLLDEPTSALDPLATERVEALILALKRDYTLVLVTHSLAQAARVADEAAFFYLGELVESGEAARLFRAPRDVRTQGYVGGRFG
jgi:phosphate transport system ATP-binding protein